MPYFQGESSYTCAEEEKIQSRSGACSELPPCLATELAPFATAAGVIAPSSIPRSGSRRYCAQTRFQSALEYVTRKAGQILLATS